MATPKGCCRQHQLHGAPRKRRNFLVVPKLLSAEDPGDVDIGKTYRGKMVDILKLPSRDVPMFNSFQNHFCQKLYVKLGIVDD